MNFWDLTNSPFRGSCRKYNCYLNWSNEVKNNGIDGGIHGKEWRRGIYVRQGSLWIFSLLLDCLSHWPANNNYVFSSFFFYYIYIYIYIFKHLGFLREVFTLDVCLGASRKVFTQGSSYSFSFFLILGPPHEVFNPKMGLRCIMEVFT